MDLFVTLYLNIYIIYILIRELDEFAKALQKRYNAVTNVTSFIG